METQLVGGNRHYYDPSERDFGLSGSSKKSLDWDLNDWKWDGDLFVATPMDRASLSLRGEKGKLVSEKRGRDVVIGNDDNLGDLSLNLGVQGYGVVDLDGKNGKKTKLSGPGVCQVDRCAADLTNAKDYHRRHKVCEEHSKASTAVVGNAIQRFCQQCSRFHDLQEFDEEKRSCRRRLAGHNRRRRKTLSDAVVDGSPLNNDRSSTYLLISLLRILSNINGKCLSFFL
ncbi:hypothetical protein GIB67_024808 [Kingdonia uniflora]|uniref:SBP-type domain-containing protein n=1 Tax=Kingdonia uniflora TaxID=39325 RepID=A0A7J7NYB3_9MAGN|nr:hypothetical protein GIB67_024808 [Kingdonia uniflora]